METKEIKTKRKVLFVCWGNICRSPMAEYLLKYLDTKGQFYTESRAISNEETGNDIYPPIKKVLDKHDIPYQRHYAKKISQKDYDEFDEIYVMERSHIVSLRYYFDNTDKIKTLLDKDIEDPWYTRNFDKVYEEILQGVNNILKQCDSMK